MVIASYNVNGLLLHVDEVRTLVKDLGRHILTINETKLYENIHHDLVSIESYTIRRHDHNHHEDWVAIYIKDSTYDKYKLQNDIPVSCLETICVEINPVQAAPFFILARYLPLDTSSDASNGIEENFKFLDNKNKEIILLGDTNFDILPTLRKGDCAEACANLPTYWSRLLEVYNFLDFCS